MKLRNMLMAGAVVMGCTAASAQEKTEYVFNPHWYLQGQIGGQYTLGEISFGKLLSPNVQLGAGYNFNKVLGFRLSVNAWQSKAGINKEYIGGGYKVVPGEGTTELDKIGGQQLVNTAYTGADPLKWKWYYVAPMVDVTVNLSNLFSGYNPERRWSAGVFAGIGLNIAFSNSEANDAKALLNSLYTTYNQNLEYAWDGTAVRFAGRAGANVDYRINDRWSVGAEVQANVVNDRYNSKKAGNADWYFNALLGVKYNLGKTHSTRTVETPVVERVVERVVEKPAPATTDTKQNLTENKKQWNQEKMRREVFFTIGSNQISADEAKKLDDIASYMKEYPEASVTVTGYADKGTGSAAFNDRIAAKRADIVENELVNRGVARDRIVKSSKGSRVQPFNTNDKNRVTICIAE